MRTTHAAGCHRHHSHDAWVYDQESGRRSVVVTNHNHRNSSPLNLSSAVMRHLSYLAKSNHLIHVEALFKLTGPNHLNCEAIVENCATKELHMMLEK